MFIIMGEHGINFDNVKSFTKSADHIIIEYIDRTCHEFVFNSEPEARDALVKLAQSTSNEEIEGCEAVDIHPTFLVLSDDSGDES